MAYRSSSTGSGNSATPAVAVPAGVAAGDIVILTAAIDSLAAVFDPADWPTGFTELSEVDLTLDGHSAAIGWKLLTGADSGSYTFGSLGTSGDWVCQAFAFSGRDVVNPPTLTSNVSNAANASPTTITATGLTAVAGDDLLWVSAPDVSTSPNSGAHTAPGSFIERQDTNNLWANLSGATQDAVGAGATGNISGSFTHLGNSGWVAWLVQIPVSTGGAVAADPNVSDPAIFFEEGHGPGDFGPNPFVEDFNPPTAVSTTFPQALTATVTTTATMIKSVGKIMSATATSSASMVRTVGKTLAVTATTTGTMVRRTAKTLTATVTVSATLAAIKVILRTLTATVTVTASMTRQVGKLLAAGVTVTASMVRQVAKTLAATVTVSATLAALKVILRTLTATVAVSSTMVRQVGKPLAVTVTTAASLVKQVGKRLSSTVTVSASLTALKVILKTLTATVTATAAMTRRTGKVLTVAVTTTGTVVKRVAKTLTATVTSVASLVAQAGTTAVIGAIDGLSRSQGMDAQTVTTALIYGTSAATGDEGTSSTSTDEGASGMTGMIG